MDENNLVLQTRAEIKVLEFKLDAIRKQIESRINFVDPVVKNELSSILNIIQRYEHVPISWSLEKPLVEIELMEDQQNV